MIPRKRVRPKMGVRSSPWIRSQPHKAFVRGRECAIKDLNGHVCEGRYDPAHVRSGTDGCGEEKPSDCWLICLCRAAHNEQHRIGEPAFERKYRIDMKAIASSLWRISPAGVRYRVKIEREGK